MTRKGMALLTLAGVLAAPWGAAGETAPPRFQLTELPLVKDGKTTAKDAEGTGINKAGKVVGGSTIGTSYKGWLWTPATATSAATIRVLPPLPGFRFCDPRDINDALDLQSAEHVVGRSSMENAAGERIDRATLWLTSAPGSPMDFNAPAVKGAVLPGWVLTYAFAVSNIDANGCYYVAGWGDHTDPATGQVVRFRGVVWKMKGTSMQSGAELEGPYPVPGAWTHPKDVNSLGHVAGDHFDGSTHVTPTIWSSDGTVLQRLGPQEDGGNAHAINETGTVVGDSGVPSPPQAFLWAAPYQSAAYLGGPPPSQTRAFSINGGNRIVGQIIYIVGNAGIYQACMWQPQGDGTFRFYDLNDPAVTSGIPRQKVLSVARRVSDSGRIIGPLGQRVYLLTPIQ
jgi:hypothetical protein